MRTPQKGRINSAMIVGNRREKALPEIHAHDHKYHGKIKQFETISAFTSQKFPRICMPW